MAELKPCPFCGGEAAFTQTGTGYESNSVYLDFKISCKKCGAVAPKSRGRMWMNIGSSGKLNVWKDERAFAEKAWNGRSNDVCK